MPYSNTYANNILNYTFGKTATLAAPEYVYIGLCTNDPEADKGSFTELSGNGYSRILISHRGQTYPDVINSASDRVVKNAKQINWTKATGDWPEAKGFGLFSAATGGTPFYYGKLSEGVTCEAGAVMLFDPEALQIGIADTDTAISVASE